MLLTDTFKMPTIHRLLWACLALSLILILQTLSANARSVVESDSAYHHGGQQHHEQHNRLVSNRHSGGSGGSGGGGSGGSKASQFGGSSANQNRCQQGWMWFNNKCWVTSQSRRDFAHAVELCKKMYNGTLPTIHSEDENEFLRNNLDLQNSPIWLYAKHNHQYNKTKWLDKSPVVYTRWDAGQPSDKSSLVCIKTEESWYMKKSDPVDGQTECVSFWEDAKWGTQVGCLVLLPVVCERKLLPVSRPTDGPNGSFSQYEQQQMPPMNGASISSSSFGLTFTLSMATLASLVSTMLAGQQQQTEGKLHVGI